MPAATRGPTTMTANRSFPRQARVRAKADFDRIFKHGRRVALPVLALHWLDENAASSGGIASGASLRDETSRRADGRPGAAAATAADAPVLALTTAAGPDRAAAPSHAPPVAAAASADVASHPPASTPRLGLAVSRKVDPRAVGRNRIKRALRETFRAHRGRLASAAYVVVARPGARELSGEQLAAALLALLRRAGALEPALPLPAPAGTMPPAACASPDAPPSG